MTTIPASQFDKSTPLAKVYCITGGEPLQTNESARLIINIASSNGYNDIVKLRAKEINSQELRECFGTIDLFSSKKIIEISFDNNKIPTDITEIISTYFDNLNLNTDIVLSLVFFEKPDNKIKNSKLFKKLKLLPVRDFLFIQANQIYNNQLPTWINTRLQKFNLTANRQAIEYLAHNYEGSLLALNQLFEKCIISKLNNLDIDKIKGLVTKSASFTVYDLTDAIMVGNIKRSLHIFEALKEQNFEPSIIIWALTREIKTLINIKYELQTNPDLAFVAKNNGVMSFKLNTIQSALRRLSLAALNDLIKRIHLADIVIKGAKPGSIWDDLLSICTYFANSSNILIEEKLDI